MRLAVANPNAAPAEVLFRFLKTDGTILSQYLLVGASSRGTLDPKTVTGILPGSEFSTVVESDVSVVVDRAMTWDANGYGSHAETSLATPATTWYLAEGSTTIFQLFYLIQNPNPTEAQVEVTYLLTGGAPVVRQYTVTANSRFNIFVNQVPGLASVDLSAIVRSTNAVPVLVERAMYLNAAGQFFGAGHDAAGVLAPAQSWTCAEGATGSYFDLFLLLANPNDADAEVDARYLLPDGTVVAKHYTVPANSRFTINVEAEDPRLADAAVSTTFGVTNGVAVIVERAMWWPGGFQSWFEAHDSACATETGTKWALANGEVGGSQNVDTYILIANTSAIAGQAAVTLLFEDGTSVQQTFTLNPNSRFNVYPRTHFPQSVGRRFAAVVESTGTTPVQIVVEDAIYADAYGVGWAAGTNAVATKIQ